MIFLSGQIEGCLPVKIKTSTKVTFEYPDSVLELTWERERVLLHYNFVNSYVPANVYSIECVHGYLTSLAAMKLSWNKKVFTLENSFGLEYQM